MSNTSSATPPSAPPTTTIRLPIAHLPSAVLPGATVTLPLSSDALRLAITAATESNDSRLLLTGGDETELGVVARVPNVGNLPTGESAAIVRVEGRARMTSTQIEAGAATFADAELLIDGPSTASTTAATRELRATLELIAEKRNSRRLPELLRTIQEPGVLADPVGQRRDQRGLDIVDGGLLHLRNQSHRLFATVCRHRLPVAVESKAFAID